MFRSQVARYFTKDSPNFLLLDGGSLNVPDGDIASFREVYNNWLFKERLYVVERVTPIFPFFVDIDHVSHVQPLHSSDRDFISSVIFEFLRESLSVQSCMVVCCSNVPKIKNGHFYDGVHLHWPHLLVNKRMAIELRNQIVRQLNERIGGDWDEIVDAAVYKTGSLRMKGSHKRDNIDRYYWPTFIYDQDGRRSWHMESKMAIIMCSVRSDCTEVTDIPIVYTQQQSAPMQHVSSTGTKLSDVHPVRDMLLVRFPEYANVDGFVIKDVTVFKRSAIIHTTCKYCLNKKGYHNSCTVYFHVNNTEDPCIYQRCFSHKVYSSQTCSDVKIRRYYHKELFALLFSKK